VIGRPSSESPTAVTMIGSTMTSAFIGAHITGYQPLLLLTNKLLFAKALRVLIEASLTTSIPQRINFQIYNYPFAGLKFKVLYSEIGLGNNCL